MSEGKYNIFPSKNKEIRQGPCTYTAEGVFHSRRRKSGPLYVYKRGRILRKWAEYKKEECMYGEHTKRKITIIYLCIGNNLRRPYIYERVSEGEGEGGSPQR